MSFRNAILRLQTALLPQLLVLGALCAVALAAGTGAAPASPQFGSIGYTLAMGGASFVCGYVDTTLGMGYGTTLSPILVCVLGADPLLVIPALLFSQLCTGIVASFAHHKAGNVSLTPGQRPFAVAMVLFACSILGAYVAVRAARAMPEGLLKLLIALIVLAMGVIILLLRDYRRRFSWRKIVVLGAAASFNKVVSGGGYGPLIVAGQIVSGIDTKSAVGVTALAEGLTCVVGVLLYYWESGVMPWAMAFTLTAGALLSVPLAAISVKFIPAKKFTRIVGATTLILGIYSVYKCWPELATWLHLSSP